MVLGPEKLAEIDAELDSFGKSDEALSAVIARAVALARSVDDDELSSLGAGLDEALADARAEAARRAKEAAALPPEARPSAGALAALAAPHQPPANRASAPPPMFEDEQTDVRAAALTEAQLLAADRPRSDRAPQGMSDIAGLSVDELFADAEPEAPVGDGGGLSDLFDDEPLDFGGGAGESPLGDELEPLLAGELAADPVESGSGTREAGPREPAESLPRIGFEDEESTNVLSLGDLDEMSALEAEPVPLGSDEFELLVDEDVLSFDPEDVAPILEDDAGGAVEARPEGGLISRILRRK